MINRVVVKGFKSIENQELELSQTNILLGEHNTGKSNFISFFRLFYAIFNSNLQGFVEEESVEYLLHKGHKHTRKTEGIIEWEEDNTIVYQFTLELNENYQLVFTREEIQVIEGSKVSVDYQVNETKGWHESKLKQYSDSRVKHFVQQMSEIQTFHFSHVRQILMRHSTSDIDDNFELRHDAINLASILYYIMQEHPSKYQKIIQIIQKAIPEFKTFVLKPLAIHPDEVSFKWMAKHDANVYQPRHLSGSSMRLIALVTGLLQANSPKVLIIDEPELGLNKRLIAHLCEAIQEASEYTQIILATQAEEIPFFASKGKLLIASKKDGKSEFQVSSAEK